MSEEPFWRHVSPIELAGRKYRAVTDKGTRREGIPVENSELKNRKTEAVDAIIAWLDERIDEEEQDMSAGEDDSSLLADSEYLQAYRNARARMTILRDTGEYTVQHLAEWCRGRRKEAEKSLQRLLESNTPYGDDAITCADSRRFAYQVIIDRCEEFAKTDLRKVA